MSEKSVLWVQATNHHGQHMVGLDIPRPEGLDDHAYQKVVDGFIDLALATAQISSTSKSIAAAVLRDAEMDPKAINHRLNQIADALGITAGTHLINLDNGEVTERDIIRAVPGYLL